MNELVVKLNVTVPVTGLYLVYLVVCKRMDFTGYMHAADCG
jgi:hypothetical protein